MADQRVYNGQLFLADPTTKAWSQVGSGPVSLAILPAGDNEWKLVASRGTTKVWESKIGPTLKHRVKDNFIQWQQVTQYGNETHGLRVKEVDLAKELGEALKSKVVAANQSQKMRELKEDEVYLKVHLLDKSIYMMKAKKSGTMLQVLKRIADKKQLDLSAYALEGVGTGKDKRLKPTQTVSELKEPEVMVVERKTKTAKAQPTPPPPPPPVEVLSQLEVCLPSGDTTTMQVKPAILLKDLRIMICNKYGLDPRIHTFDIPVANHDSLKLHQMKINFIKLIEKDMPKTSEEKNMAKGDSQSELKPKDSIAPGPPPKKPSESKLPLDVMHQLKNKLDEAKDSSDKVEEEVDHPDMPVRHSPKEQQEKETPPGVRRNETPPTVRKDETPPGVRKEDCSNKARKVAPPPPASRSPVTKGQKRNTAARQAPPPPRLVQEKRKASLDQTNSDSKVTPPTSKKVYSHKTSSPKVSPLLQRTVMSSDPDSQGDGAPNRKPPPPKPAPKPSSKAPSTEEPQKEQNSFSTAKVTVSSDKNNGGKIMIVKSSPSERRRVKSLPAALVFKLPPPPPKDAGFHSLQRAKQKSEGEIISKESASELKEETESLSVTNEEKEIETQEESVDGNDEDNADLDRSTATSDNDSVADYNVTDDVLPLEEEVTWRRPSLVPEPLSSPDDTSDSDEDDEDNDDDEGPGIVLLSVQKTETIEPDVLLPPEYNPPEDPLDSPPDDPPPSIPASVEKPAEPVDPILKVAMEQLENLSLAEAVAAEENEKREKNTEDLKELDTMITSLRSLIADTCELGGKSEATSSGVLDNSNEATIDLSAIKSMAPPADKTPPPQDINTPEPEESEMEPPDYPPPPPPPPPPADSPKASPVTKPKVPPPTKPKPSQKPSREGNDGELFNKLQHRREKMKEAQTKVSEEPKPQSSVTTTEPPQQPPAATSTAQANGGGGEQVQMQLQFLQQQVLQQQVMQLQQQFQTFQQMMSSGSLPQQQQQQQMLQFMQQMQATMNMTGQAGMMMGQPVIGGANPSLPLQQQLPMVQPMMVGQPTMLPGATQQPYAMATPQLLSTGQAPIMSTGALPTGTLPNTNFAIQSLPVQGMPMLPGQQPTPLGTTAPNQPLSTLPATGEQEAPSDALMRSPSKDELQSSKTLDAVRSTVMGSAVKRYDNLMQQVRTTDTSEVLKKPMEEEDDEVQSSYTGMAAALVEAMQERRKQLSNETSFDASSPDTSFSRNANESNDWDS